MMMILLKQGGKRDGDRGEVGSVDGVAEHIACFNTHYTYLSVFIISLTQVRLQFQLIVSQ
jgi:hypothetical protein